MDTFFDVETLMLDVEKLMAKERIRPEAEYQCFLKYLVSSSSNFLKNEQILYLIDSHGVQLRSDISYWLQKNKVDEDKETNKTVPVLKPEHFIINEMNDLKAKLKELPSEWTVVQITKKFSRSDLVEKKTLPGIHIVRFACGDLSERVPPYGVTINKENNWQENILETLENLAKMRQEYFVLGRTSKKLREAYYKTNADLMGFIRELETSLLNEWISLFRGRLKDKMLESKVYDKLRILVTEFCEKEGREFLPDDKEMNIILLITLSAHFMKSKAIFLALNSVLYGNAADPNFGELMLLVKNIQILNLSNECAIKRAEYNPVILILDNEFEIIPWEMISSLSNQPVCRISSLHLLYALYRYHQPHINNGYRILEIDSVYCLLNPSKDLDSCEKDMKEFLKKRIPWTQIEIGYVPEPKDLLLKFGQLSTYLYCGHGSGAQYLEDRELKKSFFKCLMLLFGCSSNVPKNVGGRTPNHNNTYTYILNGCPCVIGSIQNVGSTDVDKTCKEMLSKFMPKVLLKSSGPTTFEPEDPDVLKSLAVSRKACISYWTKSAFVARGIPCKTTLGDPNKLMLVYMNS